MNPLEKFYDVATLGRPRMRANAMAQNNPQGFAEFGYLHQKLLSEGRLPPEEESRYIQLMQEQLNQPIR